MKKKNLTEALKRELELEKAALEVLKSDIFRQIPWNKQQLSFMHSHVRELILSGMNQGGKTTTLCGHHVVQITGRYPPTWRGIRFSEPFEAAIGGETAPSTRDLISDRLLGPPHARGTGLIPRDCFDPEKDIVYSSGNVRHQVDHFWVDHYGPDGRVNGRTKNYVFSYSVGWERIQGYPLKLVSIDEEPEFEVYNEFSARLNYTRGIMRLSMTPLTLDSQLIPHFSDFEDKSMKDIIYYNILQAEHLSDEHKEELKAKYAGHPQAEARLWGRPVTASGMIYRFSDEDLLCDPFPIKPYMYQVIGLDFPHTVGSFAAVKVVWDKDASDVVYVVDCVKAKEEPQSTYIAMIRAMGGTSIPVAWPHDGGRRMDDGSTIAQSYAAGGIRMMSKSAHMRDIVGKETRSTMAAIELIIERMATNRFKVFDTPRCREWLREKNSYRHNKGKIVKKPETEDHLMNATEKAMMSLRFAQKGSGEPTVVQGPLVDYVRNFDPFSMNPFGETDVFGPRGF